MSKESLVTLSAQFTSHASVHLVWIKRETQINQHQIRNLKWFVFISTHREEVRKKKKIVIVKKKSNLKMALDVWNCEPFNIHQLKNKLRCSLWIKEEIKKNHQKLFIERNWSENKQTILLTTRNRESEQKCVRKGSACIGSESLFWLTMMTTKGVNGMNKATVQLRSPSQTRDLRSYILPHCSFSSTTTHWSLFSSSCDKYILYIQTLL